MTRHVAEWHNFMRNYTKKRANFKRSRLAKYRKVKHDGTRLKIHRVFFTCNVPLGFYEKCLAANAKAFSFFGRFTNFTRRI